MKTKESHHRVLELDGWRGYAIICVLIAHFMFSRGINLGRFGVEMFFVLSGRLMGEILFERNTDLVTFLKKRVSRVWPTMFLLVTILLFVEIFVGEGGVTPGIWLTCVTFTYNYFSLAGFESKWADHIWSLCIEEHMYLLLAFVAYLRNRIPFEVPLVLGLMAAFMIANGAFTTVALGQGYQDVYWRSDIRGASILLGCIAYLSRDSLKLSGPALVALGGVSFVLNLNPVPDYIKYSVGTAGLAVLVANLHLLPEFFLKRLKAGWVLSVGLISYSLYLFQQPLYKLSMEFAHDPAGYAIRALFLGGSLVLALISYHLFETPFRTFLNQLTLGKAKEAPQRDDSLSLEPTLERKL